VFFWCVLPIFARLNMFHYDMHVSYKANAQSPYVYSFYCLLRLGGLRVFVLFLVFVFVRAFLS